MSKYFDKNQNIEFQADMKLLGLEQKESIVYLSLLKLGEVGSSKIIKDSGLHGQYVYNCLDSLEEKGLVQHVIKNGRKKFSAKNPKMFLRMAEHQKKVAESLAEKLNGIMVLPQDQEYEVF